MALLASNALSPLYVVYQQQWHFSSLVVTAIFATYAVAVLVTLAAVGRLSDRLGRKRLLTVSTSLLAASTVVFALATGVGWLFVARAVQGVSTATLVGAVTAVLVELDADGDHRRASLVNTVAFVSGAASGPLLSGLCAQYLPDPTVLPFLIELALLAPAVPILVRLPETVRVGAVVTTSARRSRPHIPLPIRRPFAVAVSVVGVCWSVGAVYAALGASIDNELLHVSSHAAAGVLLFGFNVLGGVSQLGLRRWSARRSMGVGVAGLAAGLAMVWTSLALVDTALFVAGTVIVGLSGGVGFVGSLRLVNEIAPPQRRAEIVSAYNMVGYVFLAVPVLGVGLLSGPWGLLAATGVFGAAVVAGAPVVVMGVRALPPDALALLSATERADLGLPALSGHL